MPEKSQRRLGKTSFSLFFSCTQSV